MKNTVKLTNFSNIIIEEKADAAITPGNLLELTTTGVKKHSIDSGAHVPYFALEDEFQGKGIDDNLAIGDQVQVWVACRGDVVNAILKTGETIVKGDYLVSAGDGTVKKATDLTSAAVAEYPLNIVGQATEAKDMTTSTLPSPRFAMRIV